ncbi:MAG: outer membrane protein assembly factor BamC [Gammaproteobacteria bacterium]|nr:outer membrane protein assembly factor BamC [Gammaproteobacteria bacterium]
MTASHGWLPLRSIFLLGAGLLLLQTAGCGSLKNRFPDRGPESQYRDATTLPPLEVPPDLISGQSVDAVVVPGLELPAPGSTRYSSFVGGTDQSSQPTPLDKPAFVRMARSETGVGLLQVQEPFAAAWPHVAQALESAGIEVKGIEESLGYYEVAYEPVNPPKKSLLQRINLFSGDAIRYRVALSDKTEWTGITVRDEDGARESTDSAYELLTTLAKSYPVDKSPVASVAEPGAASLKRTADGSAELSLPSDFVRAWREIGMALAKAEINVEDRDRSRGVYYVEVVDQGKAKGLFKGLKSMVGLGGAEKLSYLIVLTEKEVGGTSVLVFDQDETLERSEAAYQLLEQLRQQLD